MSKLLSTPVSNSCGERGFSVVKLLFWVAVLGFLSLNGYLVLQAHITNGQVQDIFDSLSRNMADASEADVRARMRKLFKVQYLDHDDLPETYYDELRIKATGHSLEISSWYMVTIWPFGKVEAVDELGEYDPEELTGMDLLRDKTRIDLEFEPYALSGPDHQ